MTSAESPDPTTAPAAAREHDHHDHHLPLMIRIFNLVGVIGPFNFPLHLCHAHVVPALLAGNTVVVKPSDITPLCGQRYAEAVHAANLPAGVVNLVIGTGEVGAAMVDQPAHRFSTHHE